MDITCECFILLPEPCPTSRYAVDRHGSSETVDKPCSESYIVYFCPRLIHILGAKLFYESLCLQVTNLDQTKTHSFNLFGLILSQSVIVHCLLLYILYSMSKKSCPIYIITYYIKLVKTSWTYIVPWRYRVNVLYCITDLSLILI